MKKTETKKQSMKTNRNKASRETKHRNKESINRIRIGSNQKQIPKAVFELDKLISTCFSELVANQNAENSFTSEMQLEDSLSDQCKILNINKQVRKLYLHLKEFPVDRAANCINPLCLESFSFVTQTIRNRKLMKRCFITTWRTSRYPGQNKTNPCETGRSGAAQPNPLHRWEAAAETNER